MNNKKKIEDLMTSLETNADINQLSKSSFKNTIYDKSTKNNSNMKKLDYKQKNSGCSTSKSAAMMKSNSESKTKKESKNENEYGVVYQKNKLKMLRSFNSINNENVLTSGNKFGALLDDEVDQYLLMLNNYVRTGRDHKVVSTLKTLLNHFTLKTSKEKNSGHKSSMSSSLPFKHKAKIFKQLASPVIEENKESEKSNQRNSVSSKLRKNFTDANRCSEIASHKNEFFNKQRLMKRNSKSFLNKKQFTQIDEKERQLMTPRNPIEIEVDITSPKEV